MMWSVKAVFTERRSGLAGVAAGITEQGLTLVDLRTTSGWDGQVVDEFVVATPSGWSRESLSEHLLLTGAATVRVVPIDEARPDAHLNAERKARLAHPGGTNRAWRGMRAAG